MSRPNRLRSTSTALAVAALALAAVLPLASAVAAPQAPITLTVSCEQQAWPTPGQVARYSVIDDDAAMRVRARIVHEGRQACRRGATHVLVQFGAKAPAAPRAGDAVASLR